MQEVADTLIPLFLADTGIYHFKHPVTGKKVSSRARSVRGAYAAYNELCWELMGERPVNMQAEQDRLFGWVGYVIAKARYGAKKRGIPFKLTQQDVIDLAMQAQGKCVVTGIPFDTRIDAEEGSRFAKSPWVPSLDRINSRKSYTKDNCRIVCLAVNMACNEWGDYVLFRMAEAITKRIQQGL